MQTNMQTGEYNEQTCKQTNRPTNKQTNKHITIIKPTCMKQTCKQPRDRTWIQTGNQASNQTNETIGWEQPPKQRHTQIHACQHQEQ